MNENKLSFTNFISYNMVQVTRTSPAVEDGVASSFWYRNPKFRPGYPLQLQGHAFVTIYSTTFITKRESVTDIFWF